MPKGHKINTVEQTITDIGNVFHLTYPAQPEPEILFMLHISRQMQRCHVQPVIASLYLP
jgi:hypothetical protein